MGIHTYKISSRYALSLISKQPTDMENFISFDTISQYSAFNNNATLHPLVNVVDLSKALPRTHARSRCAFYTVFLKDIKCGDLRYGCNNYVRNRSPMSLRTAGLFVGGESDGKQFQPQG